MQDHMPSDLIPLHEGMVLSFVNYEVRIKFESKNHDEKSVIQKQADDFFKTRENQFELSKQMSQPPQSLG